MSRKERLKQEYNLAKQIWNRGKATSAKTFAESKCVSFGRAWWMTAFFERLSMGYLLPMFFERSHVAGPTRKGIR